MERNEVDKAKQAQREYARKWRIKNPEKAKEIQLRYWLRRAEREEAENERNKEN